MQKTAIASAIALSLGAAATVEAATITITGMNFGNSYVAEGTLNDAGNGSMNSVTPFYGQPWTADQQNWFDTHDSALTWAGTTNGMGFNSGGTLPVDNFSYAFTLTGNQVAVGTYFDWGGNNNIPVLTIFDCPESGGGACVGNSLPMATLPFKGQQPQFVGSTADDFPVSGVIPIPAAAWLFGSGLIGLVGIARRRRNKV